ncbi:hypothetical protein [Microbacterium sp.]|uniref:hypothetical protein n=1 Tax=Microbacterium sp. TaxID=51671 RepID=UPI0031FEF627|nr:hypothetical protein [Microbacterium sp.]
MATKKKATQAETAALLTAEREIVAPPVEPEPPAVEAAPKPEKDLRYKPHRFRDDFAAPSTAPRPQWDGEKGQPPPPALGSPTYYAGETASEPQQRPTVLYEAMIQAVVHGGGYRSSPLSARLRGAPAMEHIGLLDAEERPKLKEAAVAWFPSAIYDPLDFSLISPDGGTPFRRSDYEACRAYAVRYWNAASVERRSLGRFTTTESLSRVTMRCPGCDREVAQLAYSEEHAKELCATCAPELHLFAPVPGVR